MLPAAALAPTELDCRLVLPAPALPVVVGVLVIGIRSYEAGGSQAKTS